MLKEFRAFIASGNVIEFAVAVILAGAISAVVTGFVNDVVMPFVGHFSSGLDFANLKVVLDQAVGVEGEEGYKAENAIRYGAWINTIVNLIIVGFVLFMITKAYNKMKKKEEEAAPAGPSDIDLLTEIRDALKK
ncbi:MAG: large conductance mechanosensitive channel protein MscL [Bacteroidota bacterium]